MTSPASPKAAFATGLLLASCLSADLAAETALIGSGAASQVPLYTRWLNDFAAAHPGVGVEYQPKTSAGAIQDFIGNLVDFAAGDQAPTDEEIARVKRGLVVLPMAGRAVVLSYNLPGVAELRLPRDLYAEIFVGTLANWGDPRISAANKGAKLPDLPIVVVRRADPSWTTDALTRHLSAVSPAFRQQVGDGAAVQWPQGFVAADADLGVATAIRQTPGAIGYLDYGYAREAKAKTALIQNKAGKLVAADAKSGAAALAGAESPADALPGEAPDLRVQVADPSDPVAYPIVSLTWLLLYRDQDDAKAKVLRDLAEYGLNDGQKAAEALGYIPLPKAVVTRVRAAAQLVQ